MSHALDVHHQTVFGTFLWYLVDMRQHVPARVCQYDAFRPKVIFMGAELWVI